MNLRHGGMDGMHLGRHIERYYFLKDTYVLCHVL